MVSPYPQELHQSALTFLKASGFRIAAEHTEDVVFKRLQDVTPAHIAAVAKSVLAALPRPTASTFRAISGPRPMRQR